MPWEDPAGDIRRQMAKWEAEATAESTALLMHRDDGTPCGGMVVQLGRDLYCTLHERKAWASMKG